MTRREEFEARLDEIADLPEDHPDRIAFVADPQRRVLLREYLAFLEADPAPGSDPEAARLALDSVLANDIGRAPRRAGRASPARRRRSWIGGAVAVAAAVVVAIGIRGTDPRVSEPSGVLRGAAAEDFSLVGIDVGTAEVVFRWTSNPAATGYSVVLYRPDLTEAHRSDVVADTFLAIGRDAFDASRADTWQVIATSSGDEIARSRVGTLDASADDTGEP